MFQGYSVTGVSAAGVLGWKMCKRIREQGDWLGACWGAQGPLRWGQQSLPSWGSWLPAWGRGGEQGPFGALFHAC